MSYLTKKQAENQFKADNANFIKKCCTMPTDFPALRQAWNDNIDGLQKSGLISPSANWVQPSFISSPKIKK